MPRETVSLATDDDVLTDEQLKAFANPPLSIKVPAFLFIAAGVASCIQMGLELLLSSDFEFNIGFVGIFVGRGLLRFRNGWREAAILLTIFPIGGLITIAIVWVLVSITHPESLTGSISSTDIAISVFVIAYAIWQVLCLLNSDYACMCRIVSIERNAEALRIIASRKLSLSSLLLVVAALCIVFAMMNEYLHEGLTQRSSTSRIATTTTGIVTVAHRRSKSRIFGDDRVEVVIAHLAPQSNHSTGVNWRGSGRRNREFEWDGNMYYFPPADRLCEIRNGTAKFYPTAVDYDSLQAFLRQVPTSEWSVPALIEFVNASRDVDY